MTAQQIFTCSNPSIEALKEGVKYFKVNNKDSRTTPFIIIIFTLFSHIVLLFLLFTLSGKCLLERLDNVLLIKMWRTLRLKH